MDKCTYIENHFSTGLFQLDHEFLTHERNKQALCEAMKHKDHS